MLPDVQQWREGFPKKLIPLVGIESLQIPVNVFYPGGDYVLTPASVDMFCSLTEKLKGVNMSRFVQVALRELASKTGFVAENVARALAVTQTELESTTALIRVRFTYFWRTESPSTKLQQPLPLQCAVVGYREEKEQQVVVQTSVPYHSLCPCALELTSKQSSHNQRSFAHIAVVVGDRVPLFEEFVSIVEAHASACIRELTKRADEKELVLTAKQRPRFVEDMVRLLSLELDRSLKQAIIRGYFVKVVHKESIHTHDAVAYMFKNFDLWRLFV